MTHPNVDKYAHIPVMKRLMAIAQRPRGIYPHLPKKYYRRQWKSASIFSEPWRGAFESRQGRAALAADSDKE